MKLYIKIFTLASIICSSALSAGWLPLTGKEILATGTIASGIVGLMFTYKAWHKRPNTEDCINLAKAEKDIQSANHDLIKRTNQAKYDGYLWEFNKSKMYAAIAATSYALFGGLSLYSMKSAL